MIDLVEAASELTGPCALDLGTWTIGEVDARTLGWLIDEGRITSCRLVVDRSFRAFREYYDALMDSVGVENVVESRSHAKFATLRNDGWALVIRGSMNANRNTRWEQVDISDDPAVCSLFTNHVDALFEGRK